ncbi:MAG: sigma-70 family RNA polymerase sigma factor [Candidatus Omnitrophica bacterium]|nr:sigma-70 family RNA polymerase sigma factor [Candidatus Omnitrophota bacterium]
MFFKILYEKVKPKLKMIARKHSRRLLFADADDLYQEMCIHLWDKFKNGVPEDINESYIVRGCEFHLLNYLRKGKEAMTAVSFEEPINEDGSTLKDLLPEEKEPVDSYVNRKIVIEEIKSNGFSKREKEVFSFLLEGYTVRETGEALGISHVMVVKFKRRIVEKWQKKHGAGSACRVAN